MMKTKAGSYIDPNYSSGGYTDPNAGWGNVGDPNMNMMPPPTGNTNGVNWGNATGYGNDAGTGAGNTGNVATGMPPANTVNNMNTRLDEAGGADQQMQSRSPWNFAPPAGDGSNYYGSPTHGATAGAADYAGVQQFSDAAYENARRYLDPQQAFDNRRLQQEYLNRGLDPSSAVGSEMSDQMMRQHGDQDIAAAFASMQFGQGIQEQMFNQNFMNTNQAGNMQQAQWNNDIQRYNVEIARQIQDFAETMGYDSIDYRNAQFNEDNNRWDQQLAMLLAGRGAPETGRLGQGGTENSTKPNLSPWGDTYDKLRTRIGY